MTLHEAIVKVLSDENRPMPSSEIAIRINSLNLYERGDGRPLPASQISARIKNYPGLFKRLENGEIVLNRKAHFILDEIVNKLEDVVRKNSLKSNYLIHCLLFYVRFSYSKKSAVFFGAFTFQKWLEKNQNEFDLGLETNNNLFYDDDQNDNSFERLNILNYLLEAFGELDRSTNQNIWQLFVNQQVERVNDRVLYKMFKILCKYDFTDEGISTEVFGVFFNEYLNAGSRSMRDKGISSTPELLNIALSKLVHLSHGNVLLDPFAGFNGTLVKTSIANQTIEHSTISFDIVDESIVLGQMNLIANGIKSWSYLKFDSLSNQTDLFNSISNVGIADWVVTIPPFYSNRNLQSDNDGIVPTESGKNITVGFIQSILRFLKPGGKALVVVPEGFLFDGNPSLFDFRKYLVENNILKSVISLPSGVFQPFTGIPTSIIKLEMNSLVDNGVYFLNLQNTPVFHLAENIDSLLKHFEWKLQQEDVSISVSKTDISSNHFYLNANRYFSNRHELKDGYRTIKELIKERYSNPVINSRELKSSGEFAYINISNLGNSVRDCIFDSKSVISYIDSDLVQSRKLRLVKANTILCSKIGVKLKPTLVEEEFKIVTSNNIVALEIDTETILPRYFVGQLYLNYVVKQLAALNVGTSQSFVRVEDLLDVKIRVPSIAEQRNFLKDIGVDSDFAISNEPEAEYQIIKHIKHSYSQINDAIGSDIMNLRNYIGQKESTMEFVSFSDKISHRKDAATVEELFKRIIDAQLNAGELFSTIKNILEIGSSEVNKEMINIFNFLNEEKVALENCGENLNIMIFSSLAAENLFVEIDKMQFRELFRNLVVNACIHGYPFLNSPKNLVFELVQEDDLSKITLNYYNDGFSLPGKFSFEDFKSFGKRYDSDRGSGLGGHLISLIVDKHNGEILHIKETDSFPIPNKDISMKVGIHFKIKIPKL